MSFPNIPDITPDINITFEEAINLLLTSIAMEEVSLSKLIDAETNKILSVINDCKPKGYALHDAILINKSVDETIKNIIKLQMLLQFKLENIKEILPITSTTTTTSTTTCTTSTCTKTHSSSTTCTQTTTSSTSTCSTTTKKDCSCSLSGNGIGCITSRGDKFYGQTAKIYAYVTCYDVENRALRYTVKNDTEELELYSSGHSIKLQCPCDCNDKIIIYGQGYIVKQLPRDSNSCAVDFMLSVWNKTHFLEYKMEIQSKIDPKLNHDSGIVQVKFVNSDSRLKVCCDDQCNPCPRKEKNQLKIDEN